MQYPSQTSRIELSKSAYKTNVDFIHKLLPKNTLFASVVKGNAYGHGIEQFCPMTQEFGIQHYCVFSAEEAYRVRKILQTDAYILIMGHIADQEVE